MHKPKIAVTAVCLALTVAPCIAATPETKVINGTNATDYDSLLLPWQAAIKQSKEEATGCGAAVIAEHWVVTAAHCDVEVLGNTVIAGTSFIPQGDFSKLDDKYKFQVTYRHHHEQYINNSRIMDHDIALFRVDRSLFEVAKPIKIATYDKEQEAADEEFRNTWVSGADSNANLIASGWGDTVTKGAYPSQLQVVKLGGIPDEKCNNPMTSPDYFICADSNVAGLVKDACAGDSGGPIIWQNPDHKDDADKGLRLVGVTSNGDDCRKQYSDLSLRLNGQYTQLSTYRTWIEDTIRAVDNDPSFSLAGITTPSYSKDPFKAVENTSEPTIITSSDSGSDSSSDSGSGGSVPLGALAMMALAAIFRRKK